MSNSRAVGCVARHQDRPSGSHPLPTTESVKAGGPHGSWLVHYEIGQQLTGYWFYVDHPWVFGLVLSNPDAVELDRMPPGRYVTAVGCAH